MKLFEFPEIVMLSGRKIDSEEPLESTNLDNNNCLNGGGSDNSCGGGGGSSNSCGEGSGEEHRDI